jgi:hypothetical protein
MNARFFHLGFYDSLPTADENTRVHCLWSGSRVTRPSVAEAPQRVPFL